MPVSAQYALVRCPVCSGSGSIRCTHGTASHPLPCIIPMRSEERCDCCDGRGWIPQGQRSSIFCLKEGRRP